MVKEIDREKLINYFALLQQSNEKIDKLESKVWNVAASSTDKVREFFNELRESSNLEIILYHVRKEEFLYVFGENNCYISRESLIKLLTVIKYYEN